ncbi:hypothetical protein QE152_g32277 [Popillia japonica]|uniref:Uncharacterized protein n=1 Tax=Popillia japonica TaxID=7064 RepID=A0AAW1IZK5_POPJA
MQCVRGFCFVVYLYCIVHLSTPLPLTLNENESDKGHSSEIDSSKLNTAEKSKNLEDSAMLARNKRNFDYSDYYSSSSEEGYQLWHVQPTIAYPHGGLNYHHHHHPYHHHDKNCNYPYGSNEYEDVNSKERPGYPQNSHGKQPPLPQITTIKSVPNNVEFTSATQKIPPSTSSTTPTTTTTTITTTTEYVPVIDIRSTN